MSIHRLWLLSPLALLLALPGPAVAQSFGIGPRLSFVRGDLPSATPSTRFLGGTMRLRSSRHVALEAALDYHAEYSEDQTSRVRQTPFQASLLLFPVRSAFSPYLLGGMGIYSELTDTLDSAGVVVDTVAARRTGWHLGIGAELSLTRHAVLFADYRFRFVRFGDDDEDGEPIDIPGLSNFKLTHRGSMWTGGMAFYF
jgi:opacity protein-like surface antigen